MPIKDSHCLFSSWRALDDWAGTFLCFLAHSIPSSYHCLSVVLGFPFPGLAYLWVLEFCIFLHPWHQVSSFLVCGYCSGNSETQYLSCLCNYLSIQQVSGVLHHVSSCYCHLGPGDNDGFLLHLPTGLNPCIWQFLKKKVVLLQQIRPKCIFKK